MGSNFISYQTKRFFLIVVVFIILSAGCTSQNRSGAAIGIESYLQALVGKDTNQLVNASCAAWESSARQELRTFDAIDVKLDNLACQETGTEGVLTLVACSGKIVANYGNEVLEINLSERVYQALYEANEWRMCGYH